MRKRLIPHPQPEGPSTPADWLGLETAAEAEVTSEDSEFPLESALGLADGPGWKAATPGLQTVRLVFDHPMRIRRIHVEFREEERERTQQFLLRWSGDGGRTWQEIVRQQYNFSRAATQEIEDYEVDLQNVTALEIQIIPDLAHSDARASVYRLQIA